MSDTPTYDQLSALCAQMAAALEEIAEIDTARLRTVLEVIPGAGVNNGPFEETAVLGKCGGIAHRALTAYRTLSPDPVYAFAPNMHHFLTEIRSDGLIEGPRYEAVRRFLDKTNRARGEG